MKKKESRMQTDPNNSERKIYGWELILNLYECNLKKISSKDMIKQYVDKLCNQIEMVPFGETWIPYFGKKRSHTKGYSLIQLIETSSITGHFSEEKRSAYINIFSCKPYDHKKARKFSMQYFQARKIASKFIKRI